MPQKEPNGSALSESVLNALETSIQESESWRKNAAVDAGLPPESSYEDITAEGIRQVALMHQDLIRAIRPIAPDLAAVLNRCYERTPSLSAYLTAMPENDEAKQAAASFVGDYEAFLRECSHFDVTVLAHVDSGLAQKMRQILRDSRNELKKIYQDYASWQNRLNHTHYNPKKIN